MRVEPELPEHHKYIRLKRLVGDVAMESLIRLWGHCQTTRKGAWWENATPDDVELICRWEGEPGLLYRSLLSTRWIHEEPGGVVVHEWNEVNAQFIANWTHGKLSKGRPKKPVDNQSITSQPLLGQNGAPLEESDKIAHRNDNQSASSRKPVGNQSITSATILNSTVLNSEGGPGGTVRTDPPETSRKPVDNHLVIQSETSDLRFDLAREVLLFLNAETGASFPESPMTLHVIAHRLREVRQDVAGVQEMVRRQVRCWKDNPEMQNYLRPSTLFDEEKFPNYFGQRKIPAPRRGSKDRRAELQEFIDTSPANPESAHHKPNGGASAEEKEKLRAWRAELRGMT